jgi:hypothetical protein
MCELLTAGIPAAALEQPAGPEEIAGAIRRLFGNDVGFTANELKLPPSPRLRDVYAALVESDRFRVACGRISASHAW